LVNEGHHARTYHKGAWAAPNDRGAAAADKKNETFLRAVSAGRSDSRNRLERGGAELICE